MTSATAVGTTWRLDPDRSRAGFRCRGAGGVPVRGTVRLLGGEVTTDAAGTVVGVTGTADATSTATGNVRRDRDLHAPRLLDTAGTPLWHYRATSVVHVGDGWRVTGTLTARAAAPLVLDVVGVEELDDGAVLVRATGRLDRRDAGVRAPRALVWREVLVELDAVLHAVEPRGSRRADGRSAP